MNVLQKNSQNITQVT